MLERDDFLELIREIMSQGYDEETAGDFAAIIGDTPCCDASGNILVIDSNGQQLARLQPLKFFDAN